MSKHTFQYLFVALLGGCGALGIQAFLNGSFDAFLSAQNPGAPYLNYDRRDARVNQIPPLPASTQSLGDVTTFAAQDDFQALLADLTPEERVGVEIYAKRNKSVVNVSTLETKTHQFFQETAEGCGSGIVINKAGVILTNYHVVGTASKIDITLFNGETYPAGLIGVDPNTDVALVKIDAPESDLFPIEFGDSSKALVGQTVYAIGNPFGLERTMTKGIISNLNRSIGSPQQFRQIKGVIQVDAAINPGNSGGVLLDSKGRMIGMNTAIASRVGENTGVGFAVPVNTIHRIVSILLEKGEVVRGDAGVVQVTETENGLIPGLIDVGGAADEAGLRGGKLTITVTRRGNTAYRTREVTRPEDGFDLITGVNGQQVRTGEEFITAVEEHAPGETIVLNIIRNGRAMELPITLK
ncbi:MAG: trypsin-like peptidase domain-containing protein [Thermoguttaceae bacterium]|nr:trypsin-like peptidase domain-containing protein [Thermoguttaceae bacterium]MBR5760318.1 trypsin-like peptidase domain-containing protein [Thermoguttaceae bacterium]